MAGNTVRITATTDDKASKPLDNIRDKFDKIQKQGAKGFGIGVAAGATTFALNAVAGAADTAATAVIGFATDSISKASDLNETMSKAEVIFGDNAKAVEDWAGTMDKAAGQSKTAALDAASGFAGLFKTVGLGIDQSTEMSKNLTQLGSDLASFFNTDVNEALDALKSGLNGEAEPLRKFNVFLSDTAITAKLAQMGIKKVDGQFTEAQKATARYKLILEQTGDAQGDFARTGDGLANSSRTLAAEMDNLQAEVGQELLPVMRDLTIWAKEDGIPALRTIIELAHEAADASGGWADGQKKVNNALGAFNTTEAQEAAAKLTEEMSHGQEAFNDYRKGEREAYAQTVKVGDAAADARPRVKGLGGAAQKAADDFADLRKNVNAAADAIAEAAYGPEELRLEFAKTRLELKDNQDELGKVTRKIKDLGDKGKPVPRELRETFLDLQSAVVDNKQDIIRTGIKLKDVGGIKLGALQKEFADSHIDLSHLSGDARSLWSWLTRASNVTFNIGHGSSVNTHGHNAAGGPVSAGMPTLVGEKGPELFTPESNGRITPNSNTMMMGGAGGGMTEVHVYLDGRELGSAVASSVTKWQQDRRLIGAR
jgi:hypothetical protein